MMKKLVGHICVQWIFLSITVVGAFLSKNLPCNNPISLQLRRSIHFQNLDPAKHERFITKQNRRPTTLYSSSAVVVNDLTKIENRLRKLNVESKPKILSEDPLIYIVPNLLSNEECQAYQEYVQGRSMTRSNPPAVSLDMTKLWPLPWLSLLAGIPPAFKLLDGNNNNLLDGVSLDILLIAKTILPSIGLALIGMMALAWLVVLPVIRAISNSSSRTSVASALNQEYDLEFIRPLLERACAAGGDFPWTNWEAPVVSKYDPGAIFSRHGDASPTLGSEWKDCGGQRIITCICYLNTLSDNEGGATYFDQLNIAVNPIAGSALFFFPADATTCKADGRTTHESLPPTKEKWIVQLFGRVDRVPPPLGLHPNFELFEGAGPNLEN